MELTCIEFWRELDRRAANTLGFALKRRGSHILNWLIVQIFYNDLSFFTKTTIDAVAGRILMAKSPQEPQDLIEKMAANNYKWLMKETIQGAK